jgi:hypothetical protein
VIPLSFVRAAVFVVKGNLRAALHPLCVALGRNLAAAGMSPRQYGLVPRKKRTRRYFKGAAWGVYPSQVDCEALFSLASCAPV